MDLVDVQYVCENPARFSATFAFEITFECLEQLEDDLESKTGVVYERRESARHRRFGNADRRTFAAS